MAYPPHFLLQFGGKAFNTEGWSCGLRFVQNTGQTIPPATQQTYARYAWDQISTWVKTAGSGVSSAAQLNFVKFNAIGPDGTYLDKSVTNGFYGEGLPLVVGAGTVSQAPQVAVVATLHTAATRGLANKGRVYIPAIAFVAGADGLMTTSNQDAISIHFQTLINALNNNPGIDAEFGGLDVHVVSNGTALEPGIARKVTNISIGRAFDTQRRRRKSLSEGARILKAVS